MIKSENTANKRVYTVVAVFHGVTEVACNFRHYKDALRYLKQFKKELNLDEDDVQIFESSIID